MVKMYSMDKRYIGRWIVSLDGYNFTIENKTRDKQHNAVSLRRKN